MIRWLLLSTAILFGLDLALIVVVGAFTGVVPTLVMLLAAAVIGIYLAKREGLRVFHAYQDALREGRLPDEGILSALLVLVGGLALVLPGFLSDIVGIVLLFGPTRRLISKKVRALIEAKLKSTFQVSLGGEEQVEAEDDGIRAEVVDYPHSWREARSDVIDTEGVEVQSSLLLGPASKDPPSV